MLYGNFYFTKLLPYLKFFFWGFSFLKERVGRITGKELVRVFGD
jgi:hypothetical protein